MIMPLAAAVAAFLIALLTARHLARPGGRFQILDVPNERSLHTAPTPRTGGLAIWVGSIVAVLMIVITSPVRSEFLWIGSGAILVGAVSLLDDRLRLSVKTRFSAQLVAAGMLLVGGLSLQSFHLPAMTFELTAVASALVTMLLIVWMTNLYNFMDGMDGFAGGMAVFGFGGTGLVAFLAGDAHFAALCWVIAAAAAGFLVINFPPARIFMGDSGSSVLGFVAAGLSLWAEQRRLFPLMVPVLIFSPFIVDATVTLLRRAARGERVWQAHRSHYYQRLVQLGWGHRRTVLAEYGLMALCLISATLYVRLPALGQWFVIVFWVVSYVGLAVSIEILSKRVTLRGNLG